MVVFSVKQLFCYLIFYWWAIGVGIFVLFLVNVLGVYIFILMWDSIDDLMFFFEVLDVVCIVVLIVVFVFLMWFICMVFCILIFGVGRQVEYEFKQKIFDYLFKLEFFYFIENIIGDLINWVISDVDNICCLVGFVVLSLINIVFVYVLIILVMFVFYIFFILLVVFVYLLMLMSVNFFSGKL